MGLFGGGEKSSPIEKAVYKATDETLTRENWGLIIEVCNLVNDNPEAGVRDSMSAIRKRLEVKNGNVQLYALTLMNALAQNCGSMMHREVASSTTLQLLERIGLSHSTYRAVRTRLIEILGQLADQFESDPSLRQVRVCYERITKAFPQGSGEATHRQQAQKQHTQQQAPVADDDDDEDLKLALELSLKEANSGQPPAVEIEHAADEPSTVAQAPQGSGQRFVRALYDFAATEPGELSFQAGDVIEVVDSVYRDWWRGELHGNLGIFPVNYVEKIEKPEPSYEEAPQDVQDEAYIFARVPTVEKLLSIFSTAAQHPGYGILENKDVQELYREVTAMRPRLIQLIDEYSRRKKVLLDLNEKLTSARRAYEGLIQGALAPANHVQQPITSTHTGPDSVYSRSSVSSYPELPVESPGPQPSYWSNAAHPAPVNPYNNGRTHYSAGFSQPSAPNMVPAEDRRASYFHHVAPGGPTYHEPKKSQTFSSYGGSSVASDQPAVRADHIVSPSDTPTWGHDAPEQSPGQHQYSQPYTRWSGSQQYQPQPFDGYTELPASSSNYTVSNPSGEYSHYRVPPAGTAIPSPNAHGTSTRTHTRLPYPDKSLDVSAPPAPSAPNY